MDHNINQHPEQRTTDKIDEKLRASGWVIQTVDTLNLSAGVGVAVKQYSTEVGPADYVLFINAKPAGVIEVKRDEEAERFSVHEPQVENYANAKLKYLNNQPLPFLYLATGNITKFTDSRDPKPRYREIFSFHQPKILVSWLREPTSLRQRLADDFPPLETRHLRDCQVEAINNLENSFKKNKPKALIKMATGAGKTFTAITSVYRLLKFIKAKRILFLVDTRNLGEQAEGEFRSYQPQDDNRLFPELYGVTRLTSSFIPSDSQVYISTIQRLYSILKGTEMDEQAEDENPYEAFKVSKESMPVIYNPALPIEFFDVIIIDECHRSIYTVWKQVLDYFDAFQVGLTATPDNRTFGYFDQNVVSDYGYERAVIDGVLVPYNQVYCIKTEITQQGAVIKMQEMVATRQRKTRKKFWETLDEDMEYSGKQLDRDIVNPSTIRAIIREVKQKLPEIFPDRFDADKKFEVPKLLIFAKTDSHAEDIITIVREEFDEGNDFCKKITYQSQEDPKTILAQFRNNYYPRIAVTVDMIATGTDIRPLEVLLFMRDVKSRSYYEQMKGRGTRTCSLDELHATGTPNAKFAKDRFVIFDAIGVEESLKTDSRSLDTTPSVSLKEILQRVAVGDRSEAVLSTLASRLLRLDKQIDDIEKQAFSERAQHKTIKQVVNDLLSAHNPDTIEQIRENVNQQYRGESPNAITAAIKERHDTVLEQAIAVFHNPELRHFIIDIRKKYDQIIDSINLDSVIASGWHGDQQANAESTIANFKAWIEAHKDEIIALQIFYAQPYRRRELTYQMIKELSDRIRLSKPPLALTSIWRAYGELENVTDQPKNELICLVSLIRRVMGIDDRLTPYDQTINRNFKHWLFKVQAGNAPKFTPEQLDWLRLIKDHIASSIHVDLDTLDLTPFNAKGGRGKMYQLFGDKMNSILDEMNEALAA